MFSLKNDTFRKAFCLGLFLLFLTGCSEKEGWKPAKTPLVTRWAKEVSPANAHREYPRPQMVRKSWMNLNGLWEFAVTKKDDPSPGVYPDRILVPFPVESGLSGLARRVNETERLWYRKVFTVPEKWRNGRILLHFGAVDWDATVYVNGREAGRHLGGYDPFTLDITDALAEGSAQELVVSVWDPSNRGNQPVGKQAAEPHGIWYTPTSGIWRTVWAEPVPKSYIRSLTLLPDVDGRALRLSVDVAGDESSLVHAVVCADGKEVGDGMGPGGRWTVVPISDMRLWSPDSPFLYDLSVVLGDGKGGILDRIESYFGMRKIALGKDDEGRTRLELNGRFVFQLGPLDQGFWPDGLYTAPTDEALRYDIEILKKMGFNMARKHVKVEPDRWYYWCDRLGLMVWQDMPSGRNETGEDRLQFERELEAVVRSLYNHPSIIMWVPFNEGWGQYDSARITSWLKSIDSSRLVNHASGWTDEGVSDVCDIHSYPDPVSPEPEPNRAAVLGEFGGLGFNVAGHAWNPEGWGYDLLQDFESLALRYESLYETLLPLIGEPGLSAAVYTQTTDIESENNGLMTYDREIIKIAPETARRAHQGFLPPRTSGLSDIFVGETDVAMTCVRPGAVIRYTLDGSLPTLKSAVYSGPVHLTETTTLNMKAFWENGEESRIRSAPFRKVMPRPAVKGAKKEKGLLADYYQGEWKKLPELDTLKPGYTGIARSIGLETARSGENFALRFAGWIDIPKTGAYVFYVRSDDGSRLRIGNEVVVDNDGVHGTREKWGAAALEAGLHPIEVLFFQGTGGRSLEVLYEGPGISKTVIPENVLYHAR